MHMFRFAAGLLVLSVCISLVAAAPQKKHKKGPATAISASNPTIQVAPIDPPLKKMPRFYIGSPFELVYLMLGGGPEKDEFETTAEYEERKSQYAKAGIYPLQPAYRQIAYDADAGVFLVDVNGDAVRDERSGATWTSFVVTNGPGESSFLRNMAKGGKHASSTCKVIATNSISPPIRISVPISRDKARTAKSELRVMLLVDLAGSSAARVVQLDGGESVVRSLDGARPYPQYDFALVGELVAVCVYDFASGEILGRFDTDPTLNR